MTQLSGWISDSEVAVVKDHPNYLQIPPYHPSETYPESLSSDVSTIDNPAYRSVRRLFHVLGYDSDRYDTPDWNPLNRLIEPGFTVVLKPNLVADHNFGADAYGVHDTDSLVTHGSVIRAVLDYVAIALSGSGRIIVGDCPIQGTDWTKLAKLIGFDELQAYFSRVYPGIELSIRDYRLARAEMSDGHVVKRMVDEQRRDEYIEVDLSEQSLLVPLMKSDYAFGVSQYPKHRMVEAHSPTTNKYLIHRDFLEAQVMINLPKMKSHMKAALTCALKNFVGINGHKDYLPHFRFGSPKSGGDEYPDGGLLWDATWWLYHQEWERDDGIVKRLLIAAARGLGMLDQLLGRPKGYTSVGGGGWHGNDTLWRTVLDVNRAFFYHDVEAGLVQHTAGQGKRYIAILDGLVGGHRESPLSPTPIASGVMLAARNPVALDTVAAALMGLDIRRLRQIHNAYSPMTLPLVDFGPDAIRILGGDVPDTIQDIYAKRAYTAFEPSAGYRGHVEYRH